MYVYKTINRKKNEALFSADFTKTDELFKWIHLVGDHICVLKTHIDMLDDFDKTMRSRELKKKYNFMILENFQIGKTFYAQLYGGLYRIAEWADIITMHYLRKVCSDLYQVISKVLLVSQMSSKDNLR